MISGKKDAVMDGPTIPCTCIHCRSLVDVIYWNRSGVSETALNEKPCPLCEKKGGLVHWDVKKKPCPRCREGKMKIDPDGIALCAD